MIKKMTPLGKALEIILKDAQALATEEVNIHESLNRCLASDIKTDTDVPSFSKSAMDGFAIKQEDLFNELEMIEHIPAGVAAKKTLQRGQCSRIMTGAMVPEGADTVIMIEHTETLENGKIKFLKEKTKSNILYQGEDKKKGDIVLQKGIIVQPAHIGIMANVGAVKLKVHKTVTVGILATGTELVDPSEAIIPPQIRNSNSYQIQALCHKLGAKTNNIGVVEDNPDAILEKIKSLIPEHDIIVFTGGASFGDFDYSEKVLKELNAEILLEKLAIQPGKPMLYGKLGEKFLFGLSGNPVSSSIQFELLTKPLINKLMGKSQTTRVFQLPINKDMTRKVCERDLFLPVVVDGNMEVHPVEYHGSAHINAYENAVALACFPIGKKELKKGDLVDVRFL